MLKNIEHYLQAVYFTIRRTRIIDGSSEKNVVIKFIAYILFCLLFAIIYKSSVFQKFESDIWNLLKARAAKYAPNENIISRLEKLSSCSGDTRVGLLINERMLHFPSSIAAPAFDSLKLVTFLVVCTQAIIAIFNLLTKVCKLTKGTSR